MKRWLMVGTAFLVTLGLHVAGEAPAAAPKGKVVAALGSDPPAMDPHMHVARMGIIVDWHLLDDLLGRELKTMKPVPRLAESVKFSLERIIDPEWKSPIRSNFTWLKRVDVVDDHTVRLVTHKPYPLVSELLAYGNGQMLPPKYAKQVGDAGLAKNPVGTGPYKFVEWKKGQHQILEANPDYWGGAPAVKTIVFRTIPETATQIAELLTGGVDIVRALPPDQIPVVKRGGNVRISTAKTLRVVYLQLDAAGRATFDAYALYFALARSGEPGSYIADPELDAWIEAANKRLIYEATSDEIMHVYLAKGKE